jgi:hypothetical protein
LGTECGGEYLDPGVGSKKIAHCGVPQYIHLVRYYTMFKSRRMRLPQYVARMGEKINACRPFVGHPEEERPL